MVVYTILAVLIVFSLAANVWFFFRFQSAQIGIDTLNKLA